MKFRPSLGFLWRSLFFFEFALVTLRRSGMAVQAFSSLSVPPTSAQRHFRHEHCNEAAGSAETTSLYVVGPAQSYMDSLGGARGGEGRSPFYPAAPVLEDVTPLTKLPPLPPLDLEDDAARLLKKEKRKIPPDIDNIFLQNEQWKQSKLEKDPSFFNTLGSVHHPNYLWIGCSDARVPANEIMGEDAGKVFVVRNVANLVVNTDFNLMAALQFAVESLEVPHIIVCGHYECGGVRASMEKKDHVPPLENWLRNIRDVYRLHRDELDQIADPEARYRRLVELNVIEQVLNLFKTSVVQRTRVRTYEHGKSYPTPRIHACVFDPATGDLKRLPVNFKEYIRDLHDIYDLYTVDDTDDSITPNLPPVVDGR